MCLAMVKITNHRVGERWSCDSSVDASVCRYADVDNVLHLHDSIYMGSIGRDGLCLGYGVTKSS